MRRTLGIVISLVLMLGTAPFAAQAANPVNIVVLGGPAVINDAIESHLASCTDVNVTRIAGSDRYATAAAISVRAFPDPKMVDVAYVATGADYPDAVAAGPVAALQGAPILLTKRYGLPDATRAELRRLAPSTVILLGGAGVISSAVETDLARTYAVTRIAGPDRYATAAAVSASYFLPNAVPIAYISTGEDFPDALAGGPVAVANGGPILLVAQDFVPQPVAAELDRLQPHRIVILGGTGVVSSDVAAELAKHAPGGVSRLAGSNRHATARAIAQALPSAPETVYVATGDNFPDALAGVPLIGTNPLLLAGQSSVPVSTSAGLAAATGKSCNPYLLVSRFTTYYTAGQSRVTNIHLIADATDGAVVTPGAVFSLNGRVGKRTRAKGYVPAGAIIGGKIYCCDHPVNIGGGTSQFATTLYNAIFFGGYKDEYHKPHSIYFSRYPMGREATLGWTGPDVKFRNDTSTSVTIRTSHTRSSVTVEFWGWNDGRKVTAGLSGRASTTFGGSVRVSRIIEHAGGRKQTQYWYHTYRPIR